MEKNRRYEKNKLSVFPAKKNEISTRHCDFWACYPLQNFLKDDDEGHGVQSRF